MNLTRIWRKPRLHHNLEMGTTRTQVPFVVSRKRCEFAFHVLQEIEAGRSINGWMRTVRIARRVVQSCGFSVALALAPLAATAFELQFRSDADNGLAKAIQSNSLLTTAKSNDVKNTQDILASARAEYRQILGTLYKNGYYSGTISILIDGREVASLPPFSNPRRSIRSS